MTCLRLVHCVQGGRKDPRRTAKDGKIGVSRRERGRQINRATLNEGVEAGTCVELLGGNEKVSVHGVEGGM